MMSDRRTSVGAVPSPHQASAASKAKRGPSGGPTLLALPAVVPEGGIDPLWWLVLAVAAAAAVWAARLILPVVVEELRRRDREAELDEWAETLR